VPAVALRQGDRFDTTAKIDRDARKAVYVRLVPSSFSVYNRSKQLSTAELEALVRQTKAQLATLADKVGGMADDFLVRFNAACPR
jgi:hypothetical protein